MSSPAHLVVHPGKTEADSLEAVSTIFGQIEGLRADQIKLSQQLATERVANCQARNTLANVERVYVEALHKRHIAMKELADIKLKCSEVNLEVVEHNKGALK
jgi:hypothetical protein